MIAIDTSLETVITIEVPLDERSEVIERLKKDSPIVVFQTNLGTLTIRHSDKDFNVNVRDSSNIVFNLPSKEFEGLIEAIEEHLAQSRILPLDHSFETLGAEILPKEIKDVVIQTPFILTDDEFSDE